MLTNVCSLRASQRTLVSIQLHKPRPKNAFRLLTGLLEWRSGETQRQASFRQHLKRAPPSLDLIFLRYIMCLLYFYVHEECGGQRASCRTQWSPFAMWAPGWSGLTANACATEPTHWPSHLWISEKGPEDGVTERGGAVQGGGIHILL